MLWALLLAVLMGPSSQTPAPVDPIVSTAGYTSLVVTHVNRTLGTERLPAARGYGVRPGVFVTIGSERLQVFDGDQVSLTGGRVADNTIASECDSGCSAAFFDLFQHEWLKLAVESSSLATEVPTSVSFAVDTRVPARTVIDAAYAVAESRPVQPPSLALLVNSPGRGLRGQPFYLIPPKGLVLQQGAAALGLTIEFDGAGYRVKAEDPELVVGRRVRDLKGMQKLMIATKKRNPGKETIILVPGDRVSVGQLMALIRVVRVEFPQIVLSGGQEVLL